MFNAELLDGTGRVTPAQQTSYTSLVNVSEFLNNATTLTDSSNNAALTQLLPSNQSIRSSAEINVNKPATNFDPYNGSLSKLTTLPTHGLLSNLYSDVASNQVNLPTTSRLLANRVNVDFSASPILSNNPLVSNTSFDS